MNHSTKQDLPLQRALALFRQGQLAAAAQLCRDILVRQPEQFEALHMLGLVEIQQGNPQGALKQFDKASRVVSGNAMLNFNRGLTLLQLARYVEAIAAFDLAIQAAPGHVKAHLMRAATLHSQGRMEDALAALDQSAAALPDEASIPFEKGNRLYEMGRYPDALASFARALQIQPSQADAQANLGCTLIKLSRYTEAVAALEKSIELNGDFADAHFNHGIALAKLGRWKEALRSYDAALKLNPSFADALLNRGVVLGNLKRYAEAVTDFDRALSFRHDHPDTLRNLANTLADMGQIERAIDMYERAMARQPEQDFLLDAWLQTKMTVCDWHGVGEKLQHLAQSINGQRKSSPTRLLSISNSAALQKKCAEVYVDGNYPSAPLLPPPTKPYGHAKIRVGYFSSDFFAHATSFLMARLFECHDRTRFETVAFSFGSPPQDAMHQRLRHAFDAFIDVSDLTDQEITLLARDQEIDIAVDLKGLTRDARPNLFAMRVAPVQVSYLGYPGTMGAPYLDYLIADPTLIPPADRQHYTEKILYLPHCYQANDNTRAISSVAATRVELGLPAQGFVFCCFNNHYKIAPDLFEVWMRLLGRLDNSVLWLIEGSESAMRNLRKEATSRGIEASRLVFAERMDLADHLARHHAADLFLDTRPCNAHTTASDALWAGLPIVTCVGETFASRVCASLLNAVGLPELVTHSLEAYEALAFELATNPSQLAILRSRLASNRLTHPLFDTELFTKHLEAGYTLIQRRLEAGLPPDHVVVADAPVT